MLSRLSFLVILGALTFCSPKETKQEVADSSIEVYQDEPYLQDYSIKYFIDDQEVKLRKVYSDINGNIEILSSKGLLKPFSGKLLYPGTLVAQTYYRPMKDKKIAGLAIHDKQFVYLDDKAVLSNAWAGKLYSRNILAHASLLAGGNEFDFLISDGKALQYLKDSNVLWEDKSDNDVIDIRFDKTRNSFLVLTPQSVLTFSVVNRELKKVYEGKDLTCFSLADQNKTLIVGTMDGYVQLNAESMKQIGERHLKLPWTEITSVEEINGRLWFGSTRGAFMLREDSKFNYYASQRWLPSDQVIDVAEGPNQSVLVLTDNGLGKICFEKMTLYDKAVFFEDQVRQRHVRYGFNSDITTLENGDLSTAQVSSHDSDNLWTSMYLGSQLFRYLVTHEAIAKQNCIEAFEAMERLHTLAPVKGLFGRTFERSGIAVMKKEYRDYVEDYWYPGYNNIPSSWLSMPGGEWDWRASASSDQTVGQYFALTLLAEYMDDEAIKQRAVNLIDQLTNYILKNELTLVDYDGKPSLWGRWNPEYVNRFPEMVGDRRLYSSNIISFLQTAYHFTKKEKYKEKALELLYKEGYLENLTRPISQIGRAPADADGWSKRMSDGWNNSDDEMYFLAYWGLYPYALNDTLKESYREAIKDHWDFERSEKNGLWNLCYAMTGANEFDLNETSWHLKEFPLDMILWSQQNSHRKDLEFVPENFREETTKEVLPPDERPELKHNRNFFTLDKSGNGNAELGAGDPFLLPYWMGRYLGAISAPKSKQVNLPGENL